MGTTTTTRRRRDPYSRTVVRIPEQALHERVLDLAAPLIEQLGSEPAPEAVRAAFDLAITFWNAKGRASKFWGAPRPVPDHPLIACRTALANQRTLKRLRDKWTAQGKPALRARIGLHTGEAIVGNFGSESRLDFTAIGDSVNLASRLESSNGHYGTEILMSDATWQHVREDVVCRPLDKVAVKGKQQGIVIHELLGLVGDVSPDTEHRAEAHREAFHHYLARDWGKAVEILDELIRREPGDGPAALLRERCRHYVAEPPPDDWTGVHRMDKK